MRILWGKENIKMSGEQPGTFVIVMINAGNFSKGKKFHLCSIASREQFQRFMVHITKDEQVSQPINFPTYLIAQMLC